MEKYTKTFPHYETGEPVTVWITFEPLDSDDRWYPGYRMRESDGNDVRVTEAMKGEAVNYLTSDGYTLES